VIALVLVPMAVGLFSGIGLKMAPMIMAGIKSMAPAGVMLTFAILYFGIMVEVGLFQPVIRSILTLVGRDPLKVVVGTAILTLVVSLQGITSAIYLITSTAMLPLAREVGVRPVVMVSVIVLARGVVTLVPWGGPSARAMIALGLDMGEMWVSLLPVMGAGALWVIGVAWWLGRGERLRLGFVAARESMALQLVRGTHAPCAPEFSKPKRIWINALLTLALLATLWANWIPSPVAFIFAFAFALAINYPTDAEKKKRMFTNAHDALAVLPTIIAAGVFTGILSGSGMGGALAQSLIGLLPPGFTPYYGVITGLISIPLTYILSNDAFCFGILPALAHSSAVHGFTAAEIARAAIVGQPVHLLSPILPSNHFLLGLAKVDHAAHQRFTLKWALGTSFIMLAVNFLAGTIPFSR
jgi:citrate-Mg2+:H+ or citrate-Ca2+:H+ symporter, CitMHS family